jgi:CelD/BcsL family acetyltransferase involved in cellulose biosynthesis
MAAPDHLDRPAAGTDGSRSGDPAPLRCEIWRAIPAAGDERRAEWDELAAAATNIFGTPEFAATWWDHFGRGEPRIVACRRSDDGALAALWPLYRRWAGPLRLVRAMGHGCGDELSLVCRPEDRTGAVDALGRLIGQRRLDADLVVLDHVGVEGEAAVDAWHHPSRRLDATGWNGVEHRVLHAEPSPVLVAGAGGWEELLASRSRNFRQQVRGRERRLQRQHEVELRLTAGSDELGPDLAQLVHLHGMRFDEAESNTFTPDRRRFHHDWAEVCRQRGWLRLWTLSADGAPVAAWYGFRFAAVESFYQSGRDPAWESASVGFVLLAATIRAALDDGMRQYRFLRGSEGYKGRFATGADSVATVAVPVTSRGRLAVGVGARLLDRRHPPPDADEAA